MMILAAAVLSFSELVAHPVRLKPELEGVHPRVFVTAARLETLRERSRTTYREEWSRVLANVTVLSSDPPPPPGPQERRSQNNAAYAIAQGSLVYAIEKKPHYLEATKRWLLAAVDYEPWGYTYYKPNVDLAAGHLLYAIGWSYDLLYHDLTEEERTRVRASLERHADLLYDYFAPAGSKKFNFTQNHNFIPTSGLAVTALALMGESANAPKWAALARAHHHRAGELLSPDGYYYEGFEYWIFSAPWLVHFLDAWEHATGESLWDRDIFRNWKLYVAHSVLPNGHDVADFGDIWEGPLTRARTGKEYDRVYPGGRLQSNYNVLYGVARHFRDSEAQAVADRLRASGHGNLEEYWSLLWREPDLSPAPMTRIPLFHHFKDTGVVFNRTSWKEDARVFVFRAGPPEGHRALALQPQYPEWRPSTGHAHPDANSFILYANGQYLTGDTGYAGLPQARHHNTITVDGVGQGIEGNHDVWQGMSREALAGIRITAASRTRIIGEAADAYPSQAGLDRFTREVRFDSQGSIVLHDRIETRGPKKIQWHLNADTPFSRLGKVYVANGIEVAVRRPQGATFETATLYLTAPGRPGSIVEGVVEPRGHQLVVSAPPARRFDFRVVLRMRQSAPGD